MRACVLSQFSHVQLFVISSGAAHQVPLSRQEYWGGLLFHSGIEPTPLTSPALAGRFFTTSTTWETLSKCVLETLNKFDTIEN